MQAQKSIQCRPSRSSFHCPGPGDRGKRVVSVEVILDIRIFGDSPRSRYSEAGIAIVWTEPAIAHNKVILIDGKTLLTGSFNFTKAAQEKNAENLIILHDPEIARAYLKNWQSHRAHSERLKLN
jgi:phosphatidylserine/phosphatidylglycerophosphate/cardiolipin synthase-like enzyme